MHDTLHTILVVEDDKVLLSALQRKLESEQFHVLSATNGVDAVARALHDHPDLILLDIVLPQLDGLSVLQQLRQDEWGKTAHVIMLTNLATTDAEEVSKEHGVQDFLVKTDWKLDDVVKKIREVIDLSSSS